MLMTQTIIHTQRVIRCVRVCSPYLSSNLSLSLYSARIRDSHNEAGAAAAFFFAFSFSLSFARCFFRFNFFLRRCLSSVETFASRLAIISVNSSMDCGSPSSPCSDCCCCLDCCCCCRAAATAASYLAFISSIQTPVTVRNHSSRNPLSYHLSVNSFIAFNFLLASSIDGSGISACAYSSSVCSSSNNARTFAASCFELTRSCNLRLASDRSGVAWPSRPLRRLVRLVPWAYLLVRPDPPVCLAPPPRMLFELLRASDILFLLLQVGVGVGVV
mmetsp:Transcript_32489/g.68131  ORF Transcript_32489/g.68131 Transcript_32489/m.68131 type:complete len:273 (+) Transcript_32489:100-918(+)